MKVNFADDQLRRLYEDAEFHAPQLGRDVTRAYRKKVGLIEAATSELELRNMKSLHFEKLKGKRSGQHSIRLNDQWRLVVQLKTDEDGTLVVIVEIVDYH